MTTIQALSDTILYDQAVALAREKAGELPREVNHQLNGLWEASRVWTDLLNFINNQRNRDTRYRDFYHEMYRAVKELETHVPADLPRDKREAWLTRVGQAFVQHFVAEVMWQKRDA